MQEICNMQGLEDIVLPPPVENITTPMLQTEYSERLTVFCPESHKVDGNLLALCIGETNEDDKTFLVPNYQRTIGGSVKKFYLYSIPVRKPVLQKISLPLERPDRDKVPGGKLTDMAALNVFKDKVVKVQTKEQFDATEKDNLLDFVCGINLPMESFIERYKLERISNVS
jgi:hypothetical protein